MARIAAVLLLLIALEWETRKTQATEQMTPSTHNYYVAPDGSDQNTGTLESPWQTLEYALTQVSPGDVLNLRGGTYYERGITVSTTGTGSAPITIRSYPGERAVIDGPRTGAGSRCGYRKGGRTLRFRRRSSPPGPLHAGPRA